MPVVEGIRVNGDVIFSLADGAEDALDGVRDDGTRVGIAKLQECLVEKGTGGSHDESIKRDSW